MLNKLVKSAIGRLADVTGAYRSSFDLSMTIVAFHRVNDEQSEDDGLTCSSARFEEFCRFFSTHFRVVPLSQQIAACHRNEPMGGTLSITFDDGYRDNAEVAAPILKRLGLPATFFITTGFIESDRVPFWDTDLTRQPGWMSWAQVRGLAQDGFEIGCHTHTHIDMGTASPETVREELGRSRGILEETLQRRINLFAYPFGGRENICQASIDIVREEGFDCCMSCCGGLNDTLPDPYNLRRLPISNWFETPHQMAAEIMMRRV